mgnify:CR=1 FL=1|jgi:hypothetical protein|tara:strand:+ start:1455 stop:1682 length:228 start_codon:yes stop_codon:yes gene_type:complete
MTKEEKKDLVRSTLIPTDYRLIFRVLSMFVSWYFNKSILLAIIHFLFGWVYIAYVLFTGRFDSGGMGELFKYYIN